MKALYKFHFDCGRMGSLEGLFIADENEVQDAIGRELWFGEVLGKHSEIYGTLSEEDLEQVTTEPNVLYMVDAYGLEMGYNPLNYMEE